MKNIGGIIGAIVIIAIAAFLIFGRSNSNTTQQENMQTFSSISSDISANTGTLLDVRTSEEYTAGHIDGATNLSLQDIQAGALPTVDRDAPVYVYCRSGNRSAQATALLKQAGFTNITDLGAITAVEKIGGTVVKN